MFTKTSIPSIAETMNEIRDTRIQTIHKILQAFNAIIDFTGYAIAYYEDLHSDVVYQVVRRVSSRSLSGEHWVTVESFNSLENAIEWLAGVEEYQRFVMNGFIDPAHVIRG